MTFKWIFLEIEKPYKSQAKCLIWFCWYESNISLYWRFYVAWLLYAQLVNATWWRHHIETFSALLTLFAGNLPVTGEVLAQRPVTRSFLWSFSLICAWINAQIAKSTGPTWGPPGSCRPQMGPMFTPWTLLSGRLSKQCWGLWFETPSRALWDHCNDARAFIVIMIFRCDFHSNFAFNDIFFITKLGHLSKITSKLWPFNLKYVC